jgi:RecB family exonuclease
VIQLFVCTPARLNTWVDCPRHYRMKYVDRPTPPSGPPWAHNSLGASVHNALAAWWRLPRRRRTPQAAAALLDEDWSPEGFRDQEHSEAWRQRAKVMVERYATESLDPDEEPIGVERTLAARTDKLALSGRVDRLDDRDGELVVVDYKTGRQPLSTDDVRGSMALALYAIAASRTLRRPCVKVELHHLPTGEIHAWEHTSESLQRQLSRAEGIAAEITAEMAAGATAEVNAEVAAGATVGATAEMSAGVFAGNFAPRPSPRCGWCSFRAHCPEGQAAAPARDPWDALGGLDDERPQANP